MKTLLLTILNTALMTSSADLASITDSASTPKIGLYAGFEEIISK